MKASFILSIFVLLAMFLPSIGGLVFLYIRQAEVYQIERYRLWKPHFSGVSPFVLFGTRLFSFLYNFLVQLAWIYSIGSGAGIGYCYFTIWNYTFLIVFFGIGCYHSGVALYHHHKSGTWNNSTENVGVGGTIFVIFFQITSTMVFVVDVILWTVLYPSMVSSGSDMSLVLNFFSYNQHGTNLLFVLVEFTLNQLPFFTIHVLAVLIWPCIYCIFIWIFHVYSNFYPYFFMDTSQWSAPLWYLGVGFIHVFFFFLMYGLHVLKRRIWKSEVSEEEVLNSEEMSYTSKPEIKF